MQKTADMIRPKNYTFEEISAEPALITYIQKHGIYLGRKNTIFLYRIQGTRILAIDQNTGQIEELK